MSKDSDINVGRIEEDIKEIEKIKDLLRFFKGHGWIQNISKTINVDKTIKAIENILQDYTRQKQINKEQQKEIAELKEYIFIAPNLDEMTATNYSIIQREAYIRGRAEEQKNAKQIIYKNYIPKQIIYKNYIPKQKIKDKIEGLKQDIENGKTRYPYILEHKIDVLQELL